MHHTIEHPLDVDFDFASECITIQALLRFNIGKDRLHNGKALSPFLKEHGIDYTSL
jgi:hypothetical protein